MKIGAEFTLELKSPIELPKRQSHIKNMLALGLARELESKMPVEIIKQNFIELHKTELFVLSLDDVREIGEIIKSFESYAKDYPALHAVEEKLQKIKEIFMKNEF